MTNASRAQVDLDALARDLRQDGTRAPQAAAKSDPLAELARIVGQDDPFRALLAARDEMRNVAAASPQAGGAMRRNSSVDRAARLTRRRRSSCATRPTARAESKTPRGSPLER